MRMPTQTARVILLLLVIGILCPLQAQDKKASSDKGGTTPSKPSDAVHDVVGQTFTSNPVENGDIPPELDKDLAALARGATLYWQDIKQGKDYKVGETLYHFAATYVARDKNSSPIPRARPVCASNIATTQAYVFHVTHWINNGPDPKGDNPPTLVSSDWYVYRHPRHLRGKNSDLVKADLTGAGDPLIYGAKRALIVSIDRFDKPDPSQASEDARSSGRLSNTYSVTVTQGTPANRTDAAALFSALTGISSGSGFMAAGGNQTYRLYVGAACQDGTKGLPYDMGIADTILQKPATAEDKGSSPQAPSPGNVVCSGPGNTTPCAVNRTFTSVDKEYWDFGIGITIPGVRETKNTFSTTTNSVTPSVTRHTDLYALADIFPFGYLVPKESIVPHIVAGVPVTSQSLYRPYFGLAENLTGWTHVQKFFSLPVGVNFIAGVTYMKTQKIVGAPPVTQAAFNAQLKTHRVWKAVFGLEVPVSSIAGKLGGKGGSSGKGKGGS